MHYRECTLNSCSHYLLLFTIYSYNTQDCFVRKAKDIMYRGVLSIYDRP